VRSLRSFSRGAVARRGSGVSAILVREANETSGKIHRFRLDSQQVEPIRCNFVRLSNQTCGMEGS
jgi:hypothetical protein